MVQLSQQINILFHVAQLYQLQQSRVRFVRPVCGFSHMHVTGYLDYLSKGSGNQWYLHYQT